MEQGTNTPQAPAARFSAQDMLVIKRDELRSQLNELATRRKQLMDQRQVTNGASARAKDLDTRIDALDTRTGQLEQQLFAVNDQITKGLTAQTPADRSVFEGQVQSDDGGALARARARDAARQGAAAGVFGLIAVYVLYRGFRRLFGKPRAAVEQTSPQLAQLQQSIDVIALEVERISEAQRYTAKLMNERGLGAGEAQPVAAPLRESAGSKRT